MPNGPREEKRSADAIGRAVHTAKIATGEIEDDCDDVKVLPPSLVAWAARSC
ncbi:hypothetical protein [Novosphingobium sp.]|uniref:hypothetical protein n=1 Tax=Novosphingobium sp. TaxID=1874826 RepID=UPI002B46A7CC|nr:hypothetical protein [Novosphingobium sp.]HKR91333.1 hypothetical protein [Novosphingobium sp.]